MRMIRHSSSRALEFVKNPKCHTSIPIQTSLHRDLVVQSVLDGSVRSIEYLDELRVRGRSVTAASIVVHRLDGHFLLDVVGSRPDRDPDEEETLRLGLQERGVHVLEISPQEIRREPRHTNARQIWCYSDVRPTVRERERVLGALADDGPQPFRRIKRICPAYSDAREIVSALACRDEVEIDIDTGPFGADTMIRPSR